MMDSCILCLEINKGIVECIRANTARWQELDVGKTIEKHFWSMKVPDSSSWICLSCWRELDSFHKFYLRVEEAHTNFGKFKLDSENVVCFLKPDILIDQVQQYDLAEPEIIIKKSPDDLIDNKVLLLADKEDVDDAKLKKACKRLGLRSRDPLKKYAKKHNLRRRVAAEGRLNEQNRIVKTEVKVESAYSSDNDLKNSDSCNDASDVNCQQDEDSSENSKSERCNVSSKQIIKRQENDKFIVEHFKLLGFEFICDLCQDPFEDVINLHKHFSKVHKKRGYVVCCKRQFYNRSRLVDHLHCHVNPDHFKCKECGKALSDRITFDNHMLRVHRPNEVVRQHNCDECSKSFTKASLLRIHKLTHLPEEEKKFPCSDCGKNYGSPYQLNIHKQAVHLKRFVKICNICGKAINSSAEFKVHMNKHEGIPLPVFSCDICGLRLTSQRGLKLHKESQHPVGGKKEHYCPICPRISPTLTALRKHINTMHEKGYDHKCNMCEKAFRRAEALKEHMASHTGTPLYKCPWCSMTFNSNGNMHSHRKNKHPKEYLESKLQRYNFSEISKNV